MIYIYPQLILTVQYKTFILKQLKPI